MYVLGLAPNASRISIRFWEVGTLGLFARRLADHAADFALDPQPWKTAPSAYRVVLATAPHREGSAPKMDDAMSNLVGELMRAVLTGRPYPRDPCVKGVARGYLQRHSGARAPPGNQQ